MIPESQELSVPYGEGDTVVIKKKRNERERKLTQELMLLFLTSFTVAVLATMFFVSRRFAAYGWVLEHEIFTDSREEYMDWLKETAPSYRMDQPEIYMPVFEEKADIYTWLGIYDEDGQYQEGFFPEVLDSPFWGSWVWSDSDIAAQGMETPVKTEIQFQDGTARVQIMSYQSLKFFSLYYLMVAAADGMAVFFPLLIFAHRRMKYLGNLRAEITVIGQGDMEHRVTVKGHDEISALAVELDNMRLTLKNSMENERKVHRDNQELIRAVSHDLRTPLTALNGYLEILHRKKGRAEDYPAYIQKCLEKTEEIRNLSDKMFEYALVFENTGETIMQTWNPSMFAEMVKEMAEELSVQGIPVSFSQGELPEAIWKANPFLIRRLIWNLGSNIERYGDRTRTTDIQVYVEGKTLKTVMSNGMGKEKQAVGSGIGLKSAAKIAELHGGSLLCGKTGEEFVAELSLPLR